MRIVGLILGLLGLASAAVAGPVEGSRGELMRAVHADGALWLLYEGELQRLGDDAAVPVPDARPPAHPVELCRAGKGAILVTAEEDAFAFHRREPGRWVATERVPRLPGERALALACGRGRPVLMTRARVLTPGRAPVPLGGALPRGIRYVTFDEGATVLVGSNAGEWGGGLVRVDLRSGRVAAIAGAGAPVQDIAAEPGKPGCVVVAVGLVHFFPGGQLTELCGDTAHRLFAAPYAVPGLRAMPNKPGEAPYPGVAFFALARDGAGLTSVAIDGLRRIDARGVSAVRPLPPFRDRGGVRVAEVSGDLMLVLTGINARASVGGAMPIAVAR